MEDKDSSAASSDAKAVVVNPNKNKKGKGKKFVLLLFILFIIGGIAAGAWYLLQTPDLQDQLDEIGPSQQTSPQPTQEPSPTEEPVELSELTVEVLNGTGISGEAGYLQERLEDMGFEDIEVGNAEDQDYEETIVYFSDEIPASVRQQLIEELEEIYIDVVLRSEDDMDVDIRVVTGPRRNAPTATEAPEEGTETSTGSASTN